MDWATQRNLSVRGGRESGAVFTECDKYRPLLWRVLDPSKPMALWIMLNPSTADENVLDPTITRCRNFSMDWGYGGLLVCNLFDYRATYPKNMKVQAEPVSDHNQLAILQAANVADLIVCAWGVHGQHQGQDQLILAWLLAAKHTLYYLALTKIGMPKHPLYLRGDLEPMRYELED